MIEYVKNGKPLNDIVKQNYLIVRKNGLQTITQDGEPFSKVMFKIDPSKSPKHINFIDDQGCLGIYEIKGDKMRLAIPIDPEKQKTDRPKNLKAAKGIIIAVYSRVKDK